MSGFGSWDEILKALRPKASQPAKKKRVTGKQRKAIRKRVRLNLEKKRFLAKLEKAHVGPPSKAVAAMRAARGKPGDKRLDELMKGMRPGIYYSMAEVKVMLGIIRQNAQTLLVDIAWTEGYVSRVVNPDRYGHGKHQPLFLYCRTEKGARRAAEGWKPIVYYRGLGMGRGPHKPPPGPPVGPGKYVPYKRPASLLTTARRGRLAVASPGVNLQDDDQSEHQPGPAV